MSGVWCLVRCILRIFIGTRKKIFTASSSQVTVIVSPRLGITRHGKNVHGITPRRGVEFRPGICYKTCLQRHGMLLRAPQPLRVLMGAVQ